MMNQPKQPISTANKTGSGRMIATMGSVGLISGLLIVFTFQFTLPIIQKNRAEALEKAIFEVIPGAVQKTTFMVNPNNELTPYEGQDERVFKLYAGYDTQGNLLGVAVEAQGQGFQDVIRIIYGYSPEKEAVVGMKVLETKETPGLGDKIEKDPEFRANFDALDVRLAPDGQNLLNKVELVKEGNKTQKWQIEAITGATISSRAIANIIRASTQKVLPIIHKNLATLQEK